jgi:SAM-dependent methyltransferase
VAETITDRIRRYILDGGDADLRRLLSVSELTADAAGRALREAGVERGYSALDCGCGPIGALAVLAELVGPSGRVVGVDASPAAIDRARSVTAALGLGNVELVAGDLHELDADALGGPFDVAFSRLFLMHQLDPVRTLRHIAGLLRPDGTIVVHEALRDPAPRSQPPLDALADYWELLHTVLERSGRPAQTVANLPRSAQAAGLDVVAASGFFLLAEPPELGFELHAATAAAARDRALALGVSAETIDELISTLRMAAAGDYEWVCTPFFLDLTLRKPALGSG